MGLEDPAGVEPGSIEATDGIAGLAIPGNARLVADELIELGTLRRDSLGARGVRGAEDTCLIPIGVLSPHVSSSAETVSPVAIERLRG